MKIALVGPVYPYRGGIAHFTSSLASELINAGHEVVVISFQRQYPKFLYPGKSDLDPSKEPLVVQAHYILDPLNPLTWQKARKFIIEQRPDQVVFQWWTTFWAPSFGILARWLKRAGIKNKVLVHNVFPHEKRFFDPVLTRFALRSADAFIVMAESQRELLSEMFPKAPIQLASHPTYNFLSTKTMEKTAARVELGIPADRKVALFFGIVRPYKGLRLLVEAAGMLKREGNPVHLLIAGEFWEDVEKYNKLIEENELEEWVTIHNRYIPNEEIPLFFAAADVFVAPYVSGTQSGAVRLAMGFGKVVIASKIMENEFLQTPGEGVYFFAPVEAEFLAKTLQDWLNSQPPSGNPTTNNGWGDIINLLSDN